MRASSVRKHKLLGVVLLITVVASCTPATTDRLPNIVLCMGDDHGWDETGYNGHPHVRTPVLDEMASSGLRMDRFYSAAPVCSPTRGSVLTGRHPNRYGTFSANWSIRPEEISVPQILKDAGYLCGHFGKWHLGPVKAESPVNPGAMGFDEWLSHDNFFEMNPYLSKNGGPPEQFQGESSEVLVEAAIQFIERSRNHGRPFFVVLWFGSPHEPYSGLVEDLALYDELVGQYTDRTVRLTSVETGLPVSRPLGEVLRERFAEITAMDRAIGQLRGHLERVGIRQDTLLWYCGDNGTPHSGRVAVPFRGEKGSVYEGGIRVPGIIEWPARIPQPRTTSVNAVTSDILPTLCDVVGQPFPKRPLDGISLRPVIEDDLEERLRPICFWDFNVQQETEKGLRPYIEPGLQEGTTPLVKVMDGRLTRNFRNLHHPGIADLDFSGPRAILDNRYKLVIHEGPGGDPLRELFDLESDPAETDNLLEREPAIAGELEQELREWQESVLQSLAGADYR